MRIRDQIVIILFFGFVTSLGLLFSSHDSVKEDTVSFELFNHWNSSYTTFFDPVLLHSSIEFATIDTEFMNNWQINEPYRYNMLNVYIVDSSSKNWDSEGPLLKYLDKNAVAFGGLNTIVVDYQLIELLHSKYYPESDPQDWGVKGPIFNWIVTHEIGHIIKKHEMSHFRSNSMLSFDRASRQSQKNELEADAYLLESLVRLDKNPFIEGYSYSESYLVFLLEVLNLEYAEYLRKDRTLVDSFFIALGLRKSHPQYIFRTTHLLCKFAKLNNDKELLNKITNFIEILGENEEAC